MAISHTNPEQDMSTNEDPRLKDAIAIAKSLRDTIADIRSANSSINNAVEANKDDSVSYARALDAIQEAKAAIELTMATISENAPEKPVFPYAVTAKRVTVLSARAATIYRERRSRDVLSQLDEELRTQRAAHAKAHAEAKAAHDKIISQIRDALGDATATGLGSFFLAAVRRKAGNARHMWLYLALSCGTIAFMTAVAGTYAFLPDTIDQLGIIARLSLVSIPMFGTWFCGSQYIKQDNILEDYRYKGVLAQSMHFFLAELKEPAERQQYLKVLFNQLIQDPLRKKHDVPSPFNDTLKTVMSKVKNPSNGS